MATFSELRDSVFTLTGRPDLLQETTIGLRKALFKFHQADTWKRDLAEVVLDFSVLTPIEPDTARWNIPLTTFPRHRRPYNLMIPPQSKFRYPTAGNDLFRYPWNSVPCNYAFAFLTEGNIFDSYNVEKPNYFYLAGQSIYVKASFVPDKLNYWYYQFPVFSSTLAPDNITSWIADDYPDAIAEEAAAAVFKAIGKDDESATYRGLFAENLQLLRGTDVGE